MLLPFGLRCTEPPAKTNNAGNWHNCKWICPARKLNQTTLAISTTTDYSATVVQACESQNIPGQNFSLQRYGQTRSSNIKHIPRKDSVFEALVHLLVLATNPIHSERLTLWLEIFYGLCVTCERKLVFACAELLFQISEQGLACSFLFCTVSFFTLFAIRTHTHNSHWTHIYLLAETENTEVRSSFYSNSTLTVSMCARLTHVITTK